MRAKKWRHDSLHSVHFKPFNSLGFLTLEVRGSTNQRVIREAGFAAF